MLTFSELQAILDKRPRVWVTHSPTAVEPLHNLSESLGLQVSVKRDDCTGVAFGGNKVRQLEFYMGEAVDRGADTLLITGAVQSNFVRTAAAMAARFNMDCHVQLEERVANDSQPYRESGNVLLDKLLGATVHYLPPGNDEASADAALESLAEGLRKQGANPYIVHLGIAYPPTGAAGYVAAAMELAAQLPSLEPVDEIFVCSGSALTHTGLLLGLRALGLPIPVQGVCVRRNREQQTVRVRQRVDELAQLLGLPLLIPDDDIRLYDGTLEPGYGLLNSSVISAIRQTARLEGLLLDPAYTGKAMAALMQLAESRQGKHILFWHTGGQPALFGYAEQLTADGAVGIVA